MVRRGRKERRASINLRRGHRKRRRDRWIVSLLMLVSLLGAGYLVFEATRPRLDAVMSPLTYADAPPRPLVSEEPKTAQQSTCDGLMVLVDQSHTLPPDYVPEDLVSLQDYGVPTLGSNSLFLRREAAENLKRLVDSAAAYGEELVVASAYRSYEEQQVSHARLASVYGESANWMSATPGHSQHQLGTAVDFTNAAASYQVWLPFGDTSASWWLGQHAHEYGYVLAYPPGKEGETGYQWEPWHYRFVGVENAARLAESGLSLQEFLEREGFTPRC
jgi:D-alanyl-D-alanine carboxypeptidase